MELFSELYGCYYGVVGRILERAWESGVNRAEIDAVVAESGFSESGLHLIPKLLSGEWDLLREEGGRYRSKLRHRDTGLPLTLLQKRWLKAILRDRRIGLFLTEEERGEIEEELGAVEPLFLPEDFHVFDAAGDGDPYGDEGYRQRFRMLLRAMEAGRALRVEYDPPGGGPTAMLVMPERVQYSGKDDKFRLLARRAAGRRSKPVILNLARIAAVEDAEPELWEDPREPEPAEDTVRTVTIAISGERNALERCMLQFAAYDKRTELDEETGRYRCEVRYRAMEETEVLIRVLSFGPVVEVLGPEPFLRQVRERLRAQLRLMEEPITI